MIRKTIQKIIRWSMVDKTGTYEDSKATPGTVSINKSRSNTIEDRTNSAMNFTVYSAIGGKVIQFNSYNPNIDCHYQSLYIITDQEDMGVELGQIITRESLSR